MIENTLEARLEPRLETKLDAYDLLRRCPDPAMEEVVGLIGKSAPSGITVMLQGETGVGKELAARAVHKLSSRCRNKFVVVNCANQNPSLIGSELFGHERGAFTGAHCQHRGYFEEGSQGTVFLDEVSELPLELQSRILRVLEDRSFTRVGGTEEIRSNFRLVAATNRSLEEMVKAGKFRVDLYHRLNAFPIVIPPLRKRPSDIPYFAHYFTSFFGEREGKDVKLESGTEAALREYSWPGNVRELRNTIERATMLVNGEGLIRFEHLGLTRPETATAPKLPVVPSKPELGESIFDRFSKVITDLPGTGGLEGRVIRMLTEAVFRKNEGVQTRTAHELGINPRTLRYRLKRYGQM